jgi:hypothetical protein
MASTVDDIDKRLGTVFEKIVTRVIDKQDVCFHRISAERAEEVPFGRFIGNNRVSVANLQSTLYAQFSTAYPSKGHLLLIEDTTQVSFSLARKIKKRLRTYANYVVFLACCCMVLLYPTFFVKNNRVNITKNSKYI